MEKLSFYKILAAISLMINWFTVAIAPDETGKVRITLDEMIDLVEGVCGLMGVKPEIDIGDQ